MTDCDGRTVDRWRTVWDCELGDHVGMCGLGVMRWEGPRMPEWTPVAPTHVWHNDGTAPLPGWITQYGDGEYRGSPGWWSGFHFVGQSEPGGGVPRIQSVHLHEWVLQFPDGHYEVLPDDRFRQRYTRRDT